MIKQAFNHGISTQPPKLHKHNTQRHALAVTVLIILSLLRSYNRKINHIHDGKIDANIEITILEVIK